ncbi:MAG TPA: PilZ domain-containing protein [Terriglobia bacterium]|nr:PilZ domain-containing protein [Terriglobia bacterium]
MARERQGIRGGIRIPVELQVHLRWKTQAGAERSAQGKTESMSGNGLFILAPVRLRNDTPIQFTVLLPAEVTKTPMQLQCMGRVVRQRRSKPSAGLGVVIDDYRLTSMKSPA